MPTFAFKVYIGPCGIHETAEKLRAAGFQSVSEGTERLYFTYDHVTVEAARVAARNHMERANLAWLKGFRSV